jgi:rhodanese-related sulfurtransferase
LQVPEVDVEELARARDEGATIIDVRQPDEWAEGHIAGAELVPLADVPESVDELPDDRPLYLICRSGNRSQRAAEFLIRQGLEAHNVTGGMIAWLAAGKPTVIPGDSS